MNEQRKIVLAGGSGFLGRVLADHFHQLGYEVVVLSRSVKREQPHIRFVWWDGGTVGEWCVELDGAAGLVNLAGRNVNCRYTAGNRRAILRSRLDSVRVLGEAAKRCERPPAVWIQAATLAIHGDQDDAVLDEGSALGEGFSPSVGKRWEEAFEAVSVEGMRKVLMRISFVLGRSSGALATLERLARFGLGGAVGTGRQYFSWIHERDFCRIVEGAVAQGDMQGLYSVTAPEPVMNSRFMALLRRAVGRPWSPPVPRWAVHVGCVVMRTEAELALRSRRCVPRRLEEAGFEFEYRTLEEAFADLYRIR